MSKTKEQYLEEIKQVLNEASLDESLSTEDYVDLCDEVTDDAASRSELATSDLADKAVEEDLAQEDGE